MIKLGNAPVYVIHNFISTEEINEAMSLIKEQEDLQLLQMRTIPGQRRCTRNSKIDAYTKKISDKAILERDVSLVTADAALVIWDTGSSMFVHSDNKKDYNNMLTHSGILYLNENFLGGEINFPEYDMQYAPKTGDLVMFESGIEHSVSTITSGKRYTLSMWHTTDPQYDMYGSTND